MWPQVADASKGLNGTCLVNGICLVWVDTMLDPFGMCMVWGCTTGDLVLSGAILVKQCTVAPEYRIRSVG